MTPEFLVKQEMWAHVEHCEDNIARLEAGPCTPPAVVEREFWAMVRAQLLEVLQEKGMI